MVILYVGNQEVIVTTAENEKDAIIAYFTDGGRDIDLYDREEVKTDAIVKCTNLTTVY